MKNFKALLFSFLLPSCLFSTGATAAPQIGWYWNPSQSGRGFFVESHDGITFIGAYLYDSDGHAKWLVAGGPNNDPYNFTGDLFYKTNGQTLFGSYAAPSDAVVVGQISVHFTDDTHGTVTWPGGTVQIERQIFGTGDAAFPVWNGWWWNADENGSGYSVELQGNKVFIVGFMYDDSGRSIWYLSAGSMTDATTYHGDVLQFANGQTIDGTYRPPSAPATVASLDITFAAQDEATFTFTEGSATKAGEHSVKARRSSKSLKPMFDKSGNLILPDKYFGTFALSSHFVGEGSDLQWEFAPLVRGNIQFVFDKGGPVELGSTPYTLESAQFYVTVGGRFTPCTLSGALVWPVPGDALKLFVSSVGTYDLEVNLPLVWVTDTIGTCTNADGGTFTVNLPASYPGAEFAHGGNISVGPEASCFSGLNYFQNSGYANTAHWSFCSKSP